MDSGAGGAVLSAGGTLTVAGSSFFENVAQGSGGALAITGGSAVVFESTFGDENGRGNLARRVTVSQAHSTVEGPFLLMELPTIQLHCEFMDQRWPVIGQDTTEAVYLRATILRWRFFPALRSKLDLLVTKHSHKMAGALFFKAVM